MWWGLIVILILLHRMPFIGMVIIMNRMDPLHQMHIRKPISFDVTLNPHKIYAEGNSHVLGHSFSAICDPQRFMGNNVLVYWSTWATSFLLTFVSKFVIVPQILFTKFKALQKHIIRGFVSSYHITTSYAMCRMFVLYVESDTKKIILHILEHSVEIDRPSCMLMSVHILVGLTTIIIGRWN